MSFKIDPDWWKTMFDEVYLLTDARSVCDEDITRKEVDVVCELLQLNFDDEIMDLCGGHGRHSFELYSRGYKNCTILDYSKYLIEHAMAKASDNNFNIKFIRSDARNTGIPSESFDHLLIMGNSMGYIPEKKADVHILEEAYRMLRPGGWILVDVTNGTAIKNAFNPNAWHEIGQEIIVCRQRELLSDRINAREIVLSREKGLIRDRNYRIRLYDSESLSMILENSGYKKISIHKGIEMHRTKGDYGFMNHRMIATGQKI
jgi:D-alanine-D-alanine ligase